ncbi:substrate-binding periplasmic protein [Desulfosarcina sp.]|uniref:substrate-binding periplasmic protein n=1 Tax=Desulfosarcina sp. TaxID=2027861 RepID=UPI0035654223
MNPYSARRRLCWFGCLTLLLFPQPSFSGEIELFSSVAEEYKDGPDVELLTAIAGKLNAKLSFKRAPFKRRLQLMKDGEIDFMSGLLKNAAREEYIHYVSPPYKKRSDTVFFLPKGKRHLLQKYEDLYALKIGTNLGSNYFTQFDNDAKLKKDAVSSGVPNFRKLLLGRIDAVIYAEAGGIDLIYRMGIANRVETADFRFAQEKKVHFGISKKSNLMINLSKIESVIGAMIESGEINGIIVNYYLNRNLPVPAM